MNTRIIALLLMTTALWGCRVDPFCISCTDEDAAQNFYNSDGSVFENSDGGHLVLTIPDASVEMRSPDASMGEGVSDTELCSGMDEDGDGEIDEGYDLSSDRAHCGGCGQLCAPLNAFGQCEEGICYIASCAVGTHDINEEVDDGCEYECIVAEPDDFTCDTLDDDCDGEVDEDVVLESDPTNCGECGNICVFSNAPALCESGACSFIECDAGFVDLDQMQFNGCEYECTALAAELCNGVDDDCDGSIDEGNPEAGGNCGNTKGECLPGTEVCVRGALECQGGVNPSTEVCNGRDDDCDDRTDEFDVLIDKVCEISVGTCETGRYACVNTLIECVGFTAPIAEVCDGLDNDCDGNVDNGNPDGGGDCGIAVGECELGSEICQAGRLVCGGGVTPATEICDGLDNDCDDSIDENNPDGGRVCGPGTGQCIQGRESCVDGALVCLGGTGPIDETCDGLDNDCDGLVDEGNPGGGTVCGSAVGECSVGAEVCTNGIYVCVGDVGPVDELCDNKDNDCDTKFDEGNPQGGKLCGDATGQCKQGVEACILGDFVCQGDEGPTVELCDGLDNDCDGVIDNGNPGGGTPCGPSDGECIQGQEVCSGGVYVCMGGTGPVDELCDNKDNDCDNKFDEGNPEGGRLCGESKGLCIQGIEVCMAGSFVCQGDTGPVAEICDGLDNNCDGVIDDGNPGGGDQCGNATGECTFGSNVCQGGVFVCQPGITPIDELCDNKDNDCDGKTDEGDPEGGRLCGDGDGTCIKGREICEDGGLVCKGGTGPITEVCDGLDNDCNGVVDNGNPGGGAPCGNQMGECTQGNIICSGGVFVCDPGVTPVEELCDGLDNDCDGMIDELNPEGGKLCGSSVGTCSPGTQKCTLGTLSCEGATGPVDEICDGLDNNCDGQIDEDNPEGEGQCGDDTGECMFGSDVCTGGVIVCVGGKTPVVETCDGLDNDCNGVVDNGNPDSGNLCGSDQGQCSPGVEQCMGGGLVCVGEKLGSDEICDGLDNDCDINIDENNAGGGTPCGETIGECTAGSEVCLGGALVCVGGTQSTAEVCDDLDNDCDMKTDETFDKLGDVNHCGGCNIVCNLPNAIERCVAGVCEVAACEDGFVDITNDPDDGCEYECSYVGAEICDGIDNDCDMSTDEELTVPSFYCNANGVCQGVSATCGGVAGWECNYPTTYETTETKCDGLDNDCNGAVDEPFTLLGTFCSNGVGECEEIGMQICNVAEDGVECSAAAATAEQDELCDNKDNDCDGNVDERVVDDPGTSWRDGIDASAISTVLVDRAGGGQMEIMMYEASRPDAIVDDAGVVGGFACSNPDVIPWTNVDWQEANDACCGLNPDSLCPGGGDQGWRLCEGPDWESACVGPADACEWSYDGNCELSQQLACNGEEYDCDAAEPFDQDCLLATGDFPACGTNWNGAGVVYDLSGNAKEWTATGASGIYEIRGGSYTSIEAGRTCDFSFVTADATFAHENTGFRCCFY